MYNLNIIKLIESFAMYAFERVWSLHLHGNGLCIEISDHQFKHGISAVLKFDENAYKVSRF